MPRASRNIQSRGGDKDFDTSQARGVREERSIVVGIVKVNSHPTRMGVISVFVPTFQQTGEVVGGMASGSRTASLEDQPTQWRQVRWCSPFYSRTEALDPNVTNISVKNTGGFVYPAPDIGTKVLCFFPEGRNSEGYWFACAPDLYMMQSLPAASMTDNFSKDASTQSLVRHSKAPALEFNDKANDTGTLKNFLTPKRALDVTEAGHLKVVGLDKDEIRGLTTSSLMRETPSEVIGITSKGRKLDKNGTDIKNRKDILNKLKDGGELTGEQQDVLMKPVSRAKGHSIVMDDGDIEGNNNLVRIRTAKGHQLLLHDTEDVIYISNAAGTAWIQMDKQGQLDLYSQTNVNVRSANINFHADQQIKFHAGQTIQMVSMNNMHLEGQQMTNLYSDGAMYVFGGKVANLKSGGSANLDGSSGVNVKAGGTISIAGSCTAIQSGAAGAGKQQAAQIKTLKDTETDGQGFYNAVKDLKTSVDRAPTHEPYDKHLVTTQPTIYQAVDQTFEDDDEDWPVLLNPPGKAGLVVADALPNSQKLDPVNFVKQLNTGLSVGALDATQTRAMSAMMAQEFGSDGEYDYINEETGAFGKYGFTVADMIDNGYVNAETQFNGELDNPRVWTGKDGFDDMEGFMENDFAQEQLFQNKMINIYSDLKMSGGIQRDDDAETTASMMYMGMTSDPATAVKFRTGALIEPKPLKGTTQIVSEQDQRAQLTKDSQAAKSAVAFTRSGTYKNITAGKTVARPSVLRTPTIDL